MTLKKPLSVFEKSKLQGGVPCSTVEKIVGVVGFKPATFHWGRMRAMKGPFGDIKARFALGGLHHQ
jgi:hypothetical protein